MSDKYITDRQIRLYLTFRKDCLQEVAAAKAGISVSTAGRIDNQRHQLKQSKVRQRTRLDPLESIWDPVVLPLLKQDPDITPIGIFDHLCEYHSATFSSTSRRTLERRIKQWRHLHGEAKDVVFMQEHPLGKLGICDFTHIKSPVTIKSEGFKHILFNYRLVACGWVYTQVTYGGESFAAFSDGLQNAFAKSNGVPTEVRTDSLSAAYKNSGSAEDFTARYQELIAHYGFIATRNNTGIAHENGAIESPNRHIKAQLEQALKVRGSFDFNCRADYEAFVHTTVNRRNKPIATKFKAEQRQLHALPAHKSVNYSQEYVRVSRTSALVQLLQEAKKQLKLQDMLNKLDKYQVLIVDDIGYVKKTEQETSVLFELIAHRYERHSLIITSNQSFEDWDELFTDTTMTVAAIDRLVHHAHIIQLLGESYRRKTAMKEDK